MCSRTRSWVDRFCELFRFGRCVGEHRTSESGCGGSQSCASRVYQLGLDGFGGEMDRGMRGDRVLLIGKECAPIIYSVLPNRKSQTRTENGTRYGILMRTVRKLLVLGYSYLILVHVLSVASLRLSVAKLS